MLCDSIQPCGHAECNRQIRICRRIGKTQLDPGILSPHKGNPKQGIMVFGCPDDISWRVTAGGQTLIGVDQRVRHSTHTFDMGHNTAHEPFCFLT